MKTLCTVVTMCVCRSVLLRTRDVSDKFVEKIKTHILYSTTFPSENRAFYEIMWKNVVQ